MKHRDLIADAHLLASRLLKMSREEDPLFARLDPVRSRLLCHDFAGLETPQKPDDVLEFLISALQEGTTKTASPRYFGLFNPAVHELSVIADLLVAAYNPQMATVANAPTLHALDHLVLQFFKTHFSFADECFAQFTSGGSDANLTALIIALHQRFPEYASVGLAGIAKNITVYASEASHGSVQKMLRISGLGTNCLRTVNVPNQTKVDIDLLRTTIERDLQQGATPFMLISTLGYSSSGECDDLTSLNNVANEFGLWHHVDAAWGGCAAFHPAWRHLVKDLAHADSLATDPHKWLPVSRGVGVVLARHSEGAKRAFAVTTNYVPTNSIATQEPYQSGMMWSRGAIGLRLFALLATQSSGGIEQLMDLHQQAAVKVRAHLQGQGWRVENETPLPVLCVSHPLVDLESDSHLWFWNRGNCWISSTVANGKNTLRICFNNIAIEDQHIALLLSECESFLSAFARQYPQQRLSGEAL